jgi:phosphatidylglycerol lysyltransferase
LNEYGRDVERARTLASRFGWNAMAYQVVNHGISHWFSERGDAVVGFVRVHRRCIVAGAPICAGDRLMDVIAEWEEFVSQLRCRSCYFGAAGRVFEALHNRPGYSTVVLGAQPVWNPAWWPDIPARTPSLRSQMSRARNKRVLVSEWPPARASEDRRLHDCLQEWVRSRKLPSLHFLVEPNTLHDLDGRRIFVAERGSDVIGFINASPVPARQGWLVEQFIRSSRAPNGTIELLLDCMMRAVAADGAGYVTMGLVPLRNSSPDDDVMDNPAWLRAVLAFVKLHGRRFYNFDGLERFKSKFRPHAWEPIYAIAAESAFSSRTLYAIAAAFTAQSPVIAIGHGILRAVQTEWRRARAWRTAGRR